MSDWGPVYTVTALDVKGVTFTKKYLSIVWRQSAFWDICGQKILVYILSELGKCTAVVHLLEISEKFMPEALIIAKFL